VALERVGVKAVIEGLQPYLSGVGKMDSATDRLSRGLATGVNRAAKVATVAIIGASLAAGGFAVKGLKMADTIEQASLAYETLLGSATAAQERIKELTEFSAKTPFELPGIIEADRLLQTFGVRSIENLTMVGDAAAGVGVGIEEIAFWFGRAATAIEAGRPFGEAAMRLQELGLMSGQARNQLEAMQESGAGATEIMGVLTGELGRFTGLMEKQSKTLGGMMSTLNDNFNLALAALVKPFLPELKKGLGAVIEYLDEHQDDIEQFAEAFSDWLGRHIPQAIDIAMPALVDLKDMLQWIVTNQPALVVALGTVAGAFAFVHPLEAAMFALSAALVIFRANVEDLPKPLQAVKLILQLLVNGVLTVAEGFLTAAEAITDFGSILGVIPEGAEEAVDRALAEVHRLRIQVSEEAIATFDTLTGIANQATTSIQQIGERYQAMLAGFGPLPLPGAEEEAALRHYAEGLRQLYGPLTAGQQATLDYVDSLEREKKEHQQLIPQVQGNAGALDSYGSSAGAAADKTEELIDPLQALSGLFADLASNVDLYTSTLDKLLGLPTVESAQEDLELAQLRLKAFDLEEAAERAKLAREKQIADLQDRLNQIQGKGNELLEKKLEAQIAGVEKGESPAERELRIINEQIEAVERRQRRRQLEHDLMRAQAELADRTLLTDYAIEQLVGRIVGQLPGITTEAQNLVARTLEWLGANQAVSDIYAKIYLQLQDIAALQVSLGMVAPAPSFQYGGMVPGPVGRPQMILAHGGEQVIPASQVFNMPLTLNMPQAADFAMMRRAAHVELDAALDRARTDAFKGGSPLGSGIG
jgi:hypothetical protein